MVTHTKYKFNDISRLYTILSGKIFCFFVIISTYTIFGVSCSQKSPVETEQSYTKENLTSEIIFFNEEGNVDSTFNYYLSDRDTSYHGKFSTYYEDGSITQTGFFHHGEKDSTWSFFEAEGKINFQQTWNKGQRWNGYFFNYWPNGEVSEHGSYLNGQWNGSYHSYYPNGKLEIITEYNFNEIDGNFIEYFDTGSIKLSGKYNNGLKIGIWTYYDETGTTLFREKYNYGNLEEIEQNVLERYEDGTIKSITPLKNGEIHGTTTRYWPDGSVKEKTNFINGARHGTSLVYWKNGALRKEGVNDNGKKQGLWNTFDTNKNLIIQATYAQGKLSGTYTSFYTTGQIEWRGEYFQNQRLGIWINYAIDGTIRLKQTWENNRLIQGIDCRENATNCN